MTESKKEQVLKKEISMEMAREVTGGSRGGYDSNGNFWYEGDDEFSGGGGGGGGEKPVPPAKKGPNKAKPAGAQPNGGGNINTQRNENGSKGGQQNNVNAPNNLTIN